MYGVHKVNNSDDDQIIYFTENFNDFEDHVDEDFLLNKLKELGQNKIYKDCKTYTTAYNPISGTIECVDKFECCFPLFGCRLSKIYFCWCN